MPPTLSWPRTLNRELLEKEIERRVAKYAKERDVWCRKFVSPGNRSVPDRIFITPAGRVFFVEFKRWGQKPTIKQEREIARIRRHGVPVFIVDNVPFGVMVLEAMLWHEN